MLFSTPGTVLPGLSPSQRSTRGQSVKDSPRVWAGIAPTLFLLLSLTPAIVHGADGVALKRIQSVHVPKHANRYEESTARLLQKKLGKLYELELEIAKGPPAEGRPAILVGRELAMASGQVTGDELDAVKHDGYVVKGQNGILVAAGYRGLGTLFSGYALLRQLGLKLYPWHHGPDQVVEVVEPVPDGTVEPFSISDMPFFEFRLLISHLDRGRWGISWGDYGNPRDAANRELFNNKGDWMDWFHTASYLVPKGLYYDEHPDYFGVRQDGKRIPKETRHCRTILNLSHPGVHEASAKRAIEWMDMQKERRFFCVADGDARMCTCRHCRAMDFYPSYYTDRLLKWVNSVANAVASKYPDKTILTGAYIETVKPPVRVMPAPNVRVMYCPWYWSSRTTSSHSFDHPRNVTAMEEFMGWCMACPGQVALYDYPGTGRMLLRGAIDRVKLCARNDVRWIYFNGYPKMFSELHHYIMARLIWDPFLDSEKLKQEFCCVFYGPAAAPMLEYFRLHHQAMDRHAGRLFNDATLVAEAPALLREAEQLAVGDTGTVTRVQRHILTWHRHYLKAARPRPGQVEWYRDLNERFAHNCEELGLRYLARIQQRDFEKTIAEIDADPPTVTETRARPAEKRLVRMRLDSVSAADGCDIDGTLAEPLAAPEVIETEIPSGDLLKGVGVSLPFSRLPMVPLGNRAEGVNRTHAGRFLLMTELPRPLDMTECHFVELHLHTSHDVPISVYLDFGGTKGQRVDFHLHAGEQIVRTDVRNLYRVEQDKWDRKIHGLKIDFWPADNFYPYPQVHDTEVVLLGISASNFVQTPRELHHRRKAVWLTQYRSNIPHRITIDRKHLRRHRQKHAHIEHDLYFCREKFRTFTEHRALSPIFAILTGRGAADEDRQAAREIQQYLRRLCGVRLPIDPLGVAVGPHLGNVIVVGRAAATAARLVTQRELTYVGEEGYAIRSRNGRIAVAGATGQGTLFGVARFLEHHGVNFCGPGMREAIPDLSDGYLHEIYILDRPYFAHRPVPGGWQLGCQRSAKSWDSVGAPDVRSVETMAAAIQDCARAKQEVPEGIVKLSASSPLHCYVAAKLLWNPFLDTTRLIQGFRDAVAEDSKE